MLRFHSENIHRIVLQFQDEDLDQLTEWLQDELEAFEAYSG